jgi:hypothetical protein
MGFFDSVAQSFSDLGVGLDKLGARAGELIHGKPIKSNTKAIEKEAERQKQLAAGREQEAADVAANRQVMPTTTPTQVAAPQQVSTQDVGVQQSGFAGRQMTQPLAGRSAQEQALQMAQDAATGKAPSVAEMQQKKSFEEALASQYAMAAAQGNNPMAARQAAMNMGQIQQQQAQAAAQLRAQEQAQARGELAAVGGQIGTQDIQRMSADQQTTINEQAQILQAQGMNQQSALEAAKANQAATLQTAITQANLQSAEGQNMVDNWLKLQGLNDNMVLNLKQQALSGQLSAADLIKNVSSLKSGAGVAQAQQQAQQSAGAMNAIATGIGAYMASDERAKKNIKEGKGREWVRTLGSHEYNYKEGIGEPKGKFLGVMAQELEKTRPDMVKEDERGVKVVNFGAGFNAMLATMFELDRDLKDLEESFKKRAKSNKDKK